MDSTKLFRTGHTADETFYVSPSRVVLDTSMAAQPRIISQSRVVPRVSAPLLPLQIQPPRIVTQPVLQMPVIRPIPVHDNPILVYCPVCRRDYYNYQAEQHARVHDGSFRYDFKIDQPIQLTQTADSISVSAQNLAGTTQYPLIQPLQFWTNQLADSAKEDVFILKSHQNYDGVDRLYFNPPPPPEPIVKVAQGIGSTLATTNKIGNATGIGSPLATPLTYVEGGAQTLTRPPLQYESNDTNLYNFLDNAVNSKKGPKFSFADVVKNNKIITPKRQLDDWELMYKNQSAVAPTKRNPMLPSY